ncbi:hypothetical protein CFP56_009266 [Quercus suber]|uniref:Uncharacterized protein n=1 Tax=Quercus suber TaxID=58331 RepID=A0AAW0L4P7_QUESU
MQYKYTNVKLMPSTANRITDKCYIYKLFSLDDEHTTYKVVTRGRPCSIFGAVINGFVADELQRLEKPIMSQPNLHLSSESEENEDEDGVFS